MAQYSGFECDSCGAVISASERTKKTVKYDGPTVQGEYVQDLCVKCLDIPEGVEMRPLRRRVAASEHPTPVDTRPESKSDTPTTEG